MLRQTSVCATVIVCQLPAFIRSGQLDIGIFLIPMRELARKMSAGVANFEGFREMLIALQPLSLKYRFVVIGFSADYGPPEVEELTTELDSYLIRTLGLALDEILLLREKPELRFQRAATGK